MSDDVAFDLQITRQKYRAERDRRIHPRGVEQYETYEPPASVDQHDELTRAQPSETAEAIVIGAGIAGILAGVRLLQSGLRDIRIIDRASGFGGTWHQNRYPGVRCDIESYIYMPLLEETGYVPREKYATGEEIRRYLCSVARTFGLFERAILNCRVSNLRWLADESIWEVSTDHGRHLAKFVVHAGGLFTAPKIPRIGGLDRFKGKIFHTSRWDYTYTGRDLSLLRERQIGIIGSGATAIQCVPALASAVKQLYVFQRTPSSVGERNNRPTDPQWAAAQVPGWQQERMLNFTKWVSGGTCEVDLVDDGWTRMMRRVGSYFAGERKLSGPELASALEAQDFHHMEALRARIEDIVKDPNTASLLKPYYRVLCKRPCFSDEYLETFNRPNVTLVDVSGEKRISEFDEGGLITGAGRFALDCLIFATGFRIGTGIADRCAFDVVGTNGRRLSEKWRSGPVTLHGCMSNGYPNLFFLGAIQTGATTHYTHMLYEQTEHMRAIIQKCRERGKSFVEPVAEAEDRWVSVTRESARGNVTFLRECTPGYFNQEGNPEDPNGLIASQFGSGPTAFFELLAQWRQTGYAEDLAFG